MDGQFFVEWEMGDGNGGRVLAFLGESLLDALRRDGIYIESPCNGNGTCGKCLVQVLRGNEEMTLQERRFITADKAAAGYRLACFVKAKPGLKARLSKSDFSSAPQMQTLNLPFDDTSAGGMEGQMELGIAVDLGSTTIAAALLDDGGNVLAQESAVNSQRAYGADVLSRIQAANDGFAERLRECVCGDLARLFRSLCARMRKLPVSPKARISKIAIAGNTAMLHLLRGYSCKKLGQAPFEPVNLKQERLAFRELFLDLDMCKDSIVCLLPGLSAFVGADITAGLYSSGFLDTPGTQVSCFLDLGTNGEMAVGNREGFMTASAPAGPAFEGAGLSCGMPASPGAIASVSFLYNRARVQTVGQKKPCGICGSGALSAVAALRKEGLLDDGGLLAPELFERGFTLAKNKDGSEICLTQADIREIQLAKAAVRAGVETLFSRFCKERFGKELGLDQAAHVYLAGGFGHYLPKDTAAEVGLFPLEWKEKIVSCGNASLKGAAAFLKEMAKERKGADGDFFKGIVEKNQTVQLAKDERFQELFVERMRF